MSWLDTVVGWQFFVALGALWLIGATFAFGLNHASIRGSYDGDLTIWFTLSLWPVSVVWYILKILYVLICPWWPGLLRVLIAMNLFKYVYNAGVYIGDLVNEKVERYGKATTNQAAANSPQAGT
jgi:hypothetical protein